MTTAQVTAPSSASPETKAAAEEVNALARKLDSAIARRDLAYARYRSIKAETKGKWADGPTYLRQQLIRESRNVSTAERDMEFLNFQYQQALHKYRLMDGCCAPLVAQGTD